MKNECAHEWLDKPGFRFGPFWVQRSDCVKCGAVQVTEERIEDSKTAAEK